MNNCKPTRVDQDTSSSDVRLIIDGPFTRGSSSSCDSDHFSPVYPCDAALDGFSNGHDACHERRTELTQREMRYARLTLKYPARFPRKGSDTNPQTLTGHMLLIKREGLDAIGRSLAGAKAQNASGFPWKC